MEQNMQNEVWMVIQKRKDGNLPDPVKMMFAKTKQGLHFTAEDAQQAAEDVNKYLGGDYAGVYRCLLEVVEECVPETASPSL